MLVTLFRFKPKVSHGEQPQLSTFFDSVELFSRLEAVDEVKKLPCHARLWSKGGGYLLRSTSGLPHMH